MRPHRKAEDFLRHLLSHRIIAGRKGAWRIRPLAERRDGIMDQSLDSGVFKVLADFVSLWVTNDVDMPSGLHAFGNERQHNRSPGQQLRVTSRESAPVIIPLVEPLQLHPQHCSVDWIQSAV